MNENANANANENANENENVNINIRDATLRDATLRDATLRDATLRDATLRDATLRDSYLNNLNNVNNLNNLNNLNNVKLNSHTSSSSHPGSNTSSSSHASSSSSSHPGSNILSSRSKDFNSISTKMINDIFTRSITKPDIFSTLPPMDMTQDQHRVHISLDIPGFTLKEISLSLTCSTLLVKASKSKEIKDENTIYYTSERKSNSVYRYIRLPVNTNLSMITSKYKNGVLFIQAPLNKKGEMQRNIPIFQG